MYAVTFVPDATGKDGAFSVVETEQLQHEGMMNLLAYMRGDNSKNKVTLILYLAQTFDAADGIKQGLEMVIKLRDEKNG